MKELIAAIRKAAPSRVWDQGIRLVRAGAVVGDSADDDEIALRVETPRAAAATVLLYPEDQEWDCDCGAKGVCSHVAAAALAVSQARERGDELPQAERTRLRYRLRSENDALFVERFLVDATGAEQPLTVRLAQVPDTMTSRADLHLDRELGYRPNTPLRADQLETVLEQLGEISDIWLDGRAVQASADTVAPRARIRDSGDGVELRIERDPSIDEVVAGGVVRVGDTIHPMTAVELTGPKLEALPFVRRFARGELGALASGLLPELSQRILVEIETDRIPGLTRSVRPRIDIEVGQDGDALTVLPTIVYGDPPQARIDGDRLVHLSGTVPVRDLAAEKRLVFELRDSLNMMPGRRVKLAGPDAMALAQRLAHWQGTLSGTGATLFHETPLAPELEIDGDAFDIAFNANDGREAAPADVIRAWRRGDEQAPLLGGGWAPVPRDFLDKYGHLVADLLSARRDDRSVPKHALPDLAALCDELNFPPPPGLDLLRPLLESFEGIPTAELPTNLSADLRSYQRVGVNWLLFLREAGLGGVLADDMGLGKTLQALCALRGKSLIVCPTSVIQNWAKETERFRPGLRVNVYHGPGRNLDDADEADIVLTTYALLRLDAATLTERKWDCVVLDEAQYIKNPDSQVAAAAYKLNAEFRITLTGTPLENRLDELWSQLHFTNPGLLGGRTDFRDRYVRPMAEGDLEAAARLRARIRPFVLRRLKAEVAPELPPRTEAVLRCELNDNERTAYNTVLAAAQADIVKQLQQGGGVMAALEALLRLRQASCHTGLLPGRSSDSSTKVDLLLEVLDEAVAEGHKALVFSQWTSLLDLVEPHLQKAKLDYARLDGSTRNRADVIDRFQDPEGPPVLLISLKAGGTGLNLTAADHVILLDPWWNPAVEAQAADRAHRIGQDKPVFVYRLVAADTVEERVLELQDRKRALLDAALGDAGAAANITRDDLLALLG